MLVLGGFAFSNYYSKVKLALLEKGVPYEEELNWASKDEATLAASPLGKVPFLRTDEGALSESHVILEYIEDAYPEHPLLPADPWQRAKVRELIIYLELHLELVARPLYPQAFFGGKVSDSLIERTRPELERNIAAFARLAKFSPFLAGDSFTLADCAGYVHLPLISMAGKAVWGEDLLAGLPVQDYLKRLGERETVQRVKAERKANGELMARVKPRVA
jgi:glutathione S-transferase